MMARIKIREKKSEPDWLVQHRLAKQKKFDRKIKHKQVKCGKPTTYPSLDDMWPEAFDKGRIYANKVERTN